MIKINKFFEYNCSLNAKATFINLLAAFVHIRLLFRKLNGDRLCAFGPSLDLATVFEVVCLSKIRFLEFLKVPDLCFIVLLQLCICA